MVHHATTQSRDPVVLDLSAVTDLDATGLAAVLHAVNGFEVADRRCVVVAPPGRGRLLLQLAAPPHGLELAATRAEALARVRQ